MPSTGPRLPLSKEIKTIAVVGPNADDRDVLFANYKGLASETITLLDGIREAVPDAVIYYSLGCHVSKTELRDDETSLLSEAVSCAMAADAVIIATGINSRIEGKKQIQDIEDWMNALERKLLDGLSADEKVQHYFKELAA